jgi:hypothetical protein
MPEQLLIVSKVSTGCEPSPEEFIRSLYKPLDAILKYLEELDHRSEGH